MAASKATSKKGLGVRSSRVSTVVGRRHGGGGDDVEVRSYKNKKTKRLIYAVPSIRSGTGPGCTNERRAALEVAEQNGTGKKEARTSQIPF